MKIENGNTMEEFNQELKKINSTSCAIVNKRKGAINISLQFDNNQFQKWTIKKAPNMFQLPKKKTGKKYDTFLDALQEFYKTNNILDADSCDTVLCYRNTEEKKVNGKIISNWFQLDLGIPYSIKNGQPYFQVLRLELNEWEYEKMMETRLAFTHDNIIYPILKVARHSVGTKLDCSVAFKSVDTCPLGAALLIAEKFSNLKYLQVMYRECTERIRPILSVGGETFVHVPITEFFHQAIAHIPGIFNLEKWYVTSMDACAYFSLHEYEENMLLKIEGGDLPGKSMKISAILVYHDFEIPLKVNRLIHKGHISSEQYQQLFSGIYDAFNAYMQKREDIIHCPDLSEIKRCLGKKRCTIINFDELGLLYDKRDLVAKRIIDDTYMELPDVQREKLFSYYGSLFF